MTLIPPRQEGDMDRNSWKYSSLSGKVVTLDELKKEFPENEEWHGVAELKRESSSNGVEKGYVPYGRQHKKYASHTELIAYQCDGCKKLVAGPPKTTDIDTIGILCGHRGYEVRCGQCNHTLDEVITRMS